MIGLIACGLSGLSLPIATHLQNTPAASLGALLRGALYLVSERAWSGPGRLCGESVG